MGTEGSNPSVSANDESPSLWRAFIVGGDGRTRTLSWAHAREGPRPPHRGGWGSEWGVKSLRLRQR